MDQAFLVTIGALLMFINPCSGASLDKKEEDGKHFLSLQFMFSSIRDKFDSFHFPTPISGKYSI